MPTRISSDPLTLLCFLPIAIWEGWLWRLLVDRVFLNHDDELWQGYGVLSTQFAGELAV